MNLNKRAFTLCVPLLSGAERLGIEAHASACGATILDFGVNAPGSVEAGVLLARISMADLGVVEVSRTPDDARGAVQVDVAQPVMACLAAQYAGWEIKGDKFFAMGSGPMRAAAAREPLFEDLGYRESTDVAVGVLESGKFPPDEVSEEIATKCGVTPDRLVLLVARTRSVAGSLQIVARSVETALHKLHYLKFDVKRILRGAGSTPIPPLAMDDLTAIGWTNDAILYGGRVRLWVDADDETLQEIGRQMPSSASRDFGLPFREILASFGNDFYQVDPMLFSPASVTLVNHQSGHSFTYGDVRADLVEASFGIAE